MRFIVAVLLSGCASSNHYCTTPTAQVPTFLLAGAVAANTTATDAAQLARATIGTTAGDPQAWQRFAAAIDFTHYDAAVVQTRGAYRGLVQESPKHAVLVFSHVCSPCGGGNPGSYESALAAAEESERPATVIAEVPKGSHVTVSVCNPSCPTCRRDIP